MEMERLGTAFHEAGHAVFSIVLKFRFENISLYKDDDKNGFLKFLDGEPEPELENRCDRECVYCQREVFERRAQVAVAGPLAEKKFNPKSKWRVHGRDDLRKARQQLNGGFVPISEGDNKELLESYLKYMKVMVANALPNYWHCVKRVAMKLFESETLSYGEVADICKPGEGVGNQ